MLEYMTLAFVPTFILTKYWQVAFVHSGVTVLCKVNKREDGMFTCKHLSEDLIFNKYGVCVGSSRSTGNPTHISMRPVNFKVEEEGDYYHGCCNLS